MSVRLPDTTKAIRALRKAGIEHFEIRFDNEGRPIISVRPGVANDATDIEAELAALDQNDAA